MHKLFYVLFVLFTLVAVNAQDLGVQSATTGIDSDARDQLKNIVKNKYSSGDVQRFWKSYSDLSISMIKYPEPLIGIKTSRLAKIEYVEMKYTVEHDYADLSQKVIIKKGTQIEPLKFTQLKYGLLFIDGRDQQQVNYALAQITLEPLKIVLTAGSPYELRLKYRDFKWMGAKTVPFYFDQRKMIINQLRRLYHINIETVPVKLTQQGSMMRLNWGY